MDDQEKIIIESDEIDFDAQIESKPTIRVLSFFLGIEHYCIDIASAKEVFKPTSITKTPNTPPFVVGVTNLHGEIIPILDIKHFLGLEQKEGLGGAKIIATDVGRNLIGIMVDDIGEALEIFEESIQPPIATIKGVLAKFTKGQIEIGADILILLDLGSVLECEEIRDLKKR